MKTSMKSLTVTALAVLLMSLSSAQAQYQATGDDGITASPKVRAMLDGQKRSGSAPGDKIDRLLVGSPKVNAHFRASERLASAPGDKIYRGAMPMSPKVHQKLMESGNHPAIAPIK